MTASRGLLKIGDFARVADTNLRTLRYYEELGLLIPARRSRGGFRYYRRTDVHRVRLIRDLQELGLHLDRIRVLIAGPDASSDREGYRRCVHEALAEHERLLVARMDSLEEQRGKVRAALAKLEECRHCVHSPCPENNFCEPCLTTGRALPEHLSALYR